MAYNHNQYTNWGYTSGNGGIPQRGMSRDSGGPPWSSPGVTQWQNANKHWSRNYPAGSKDCHICPGGGGQARQHVRPQHTQHSRARPIAVQTGTEELEASTSSRCGMLWVVVVVVILFPATFFISYIVAWQMGHIDPILPFISDTAMYHPESCIFAELLNFSALFVAILMYIRYRQVAEYMTNVQSVHPARVNMASLIIGLVSAFGITIVANFPHSEQLVYLAWIHSVGSWLAFGLGIVYAWLNVALSFVTRRRLSTLLVCWVRVVFAFVATAMYALYLVGGSVRLLAAYQWVLMTSLVLFFFTYINEFRYITVKRPDVVIIDNEQHSPA